MSTVRHFRRSRMIQYLPAIALLFAGLNLLTGRFAFPDDRISLLLAIVAILIGAADLVYKWITPAMVLTPWSIAWHPAPLRKKRELVFSTVKH